MAVTLVRTRPLNVPLVLTCTRLDGLEPGDLLWITAPDTEDVRVVQDGVTVDTGAIPADYYRIPAGSSQPYEVKSDPILLAGSVGGGSASVRRVGPVIP